MASTPVVQTHTPSQSLAYSPTIEHTVEPSNPAVHSVEKKEKSTGSSSSIHSTEKRRIQDPAVLAAREEEDIEANRERRAASYRKLRPFILGALALLILGWWISATVLQATRHRWSVWSLTVINLDGPGSQSRSLTYKRFSQGRSNHSCLVLHSVRY